ncbi:hypothetical protein [Peredibacter starrii]|uniref:Uncharacterized protein n=1 Tax=Peredibacter starrii TaxID=28202 RepID=A0AAX4HIY3_9BACT|nr:hypothetical protein [Peredibacter starrii]WPU63203.1 hypothetical protein SOO65_10955 [Peredibacter starrii]
MHIDSNSGYQIDLFGNIPVLDAWWKKSKTKNRVLTLVLITWVPLLLLSLLASRETILTDYAIHMRFLIALPLLLISSMKSGERLRESFYQFIEAEILDPEDYNKLKYEINRTRELRDSKFAKIIILLLVYTVVGLYLFQFKNIENPIWRTADDGFSPAGWWFNLISQPLYFYFLFYFLYRTGLWCRLLKKVSGMKLHLKASNGDDAGGLGFLGHLLVFFIVPCFAISISLAGSMLNLVLYEGIDVNDIKFILGVLCAGFLLLLAGPLLFFFPAMKEAKHRGISEYGTLMGRQLHAFERKWLVREIDPKDNILQDEDFQSIDSNNAVIARVHSMRLVPFSLKDLVPLLVAILLPFIPVVAIKVPWKVLLAQITKVIM